MTPLALTQGDPAGVGPELALQAWKALRGDLSFVYLGSADQMASLAADAGMQIARIEDPARAGAAMPHGLPVLDQPLADVPRPGSASRANAPAVVEAIDRAVALCQSGAAGGLVTNPIAKHVLVEGAGFAHPGHTEYLAARAGVDRSVMMLVGDDLKTVPVTIHMPLAEVPAALTSDEIEATIRIVDTALRRDFGLDAPRIAVAGLNPHAGEGGLMGWEDDIVIRPALERLSAEGLAVTGPHPADTMFHGPARARYDVAVCMYHDQALIPVKTLSFSTGVNMTLGLPFVRTSPDHGTAFDIAGKGIADAGALIAALRLAAEVAERRAA